LQKRKLVTSKQSPFLLGITIGILDDLAKDLFSNPAIYNINSVQICLNEHLLVLGVADVVGNSLNSRKCSGRQMPLVVNVAKGRLANKQAVIKRLA
jgi:hypothetical protein